MRRCSIALAAVMLVAAPAGSFGGLALAQTPPNRTDIMGYKGLLSSVIRENVEETRRLLASGADPNMADADGRTPLIVAAHRGPLELARVLAAGGAHVPAQPQQRYDIVPMNITSPYDGTALIAAAHLGHHRSVAELIMAGAPLDHVNNIGMTALIEAITLGDGGAKHQATAKLLLDAGANPNLADRTGATPLTLARSRGYGAIADMIIRAGGR